VSIHDVAPSTWDACRRLIDGVRQVADIPLTLLVVPNYHRLGEYASGAYEAELNRCLEQGHELALHGYTHLDEEPMRLWSRFDRTVRTRKEGEFAALSEAHATLRLERGTAWFAQRRWPLTGFVAPAWLLSNGTWQALRDFTFGYTTTLNRFYLLPDRDSILSPSLVYSSRNAWLYRASRVRNNVLASLLSQKSLLRLSLHPPDATNETMSDWQTLLHAMLKTHTAMTKAQFAGLNARYA
jgi:uncharacterized protein